METAPQFPGAGQPLPGCQVFAQNGKNYLRRELLSNADFATVGEPELHAAYLIADVLRAQD